MIVISRPTIPKRVKVAVWDKYIGHKKAEGKCYVCKEPIHITDFEVGHNIAVVKGGTDNPRNLMPICQNCNRSMGTRAIETFKKKYFPEVTKETMVSYRCNLLVNRRFLYCGKKRQISPV